MTVLAVARNALLESIRQPVFVVLLGVGILALVLNVNLAAFAFEEDNKLLIDLGLSTLFLVGILLAAFNATGVLAREIDNKTVLTVVSKPVSRATLVVGKYLGVAAAIAVGFWSLTAVFLLAVRHRVQAGVRMEDTFDLPVLLFGLLFGGLALLVAGLANYLYRRPFPSLFAVGLAVAMSAAVAVVACISRDWEFQSPLVEWNGQLMMALALVFQAVLVLAAVAIAASTRLGQVMTLAACLGTFLVGLVSEYFLGTLVAADGPAHPARMLAWPLYAAIPNLQFFWSADALTQGHPMTAAYFLTVSLYAALLVGAIMSLAVLLFQTRDVG
ncbi:MAG: ABC transporter permease [Planctomycetia bacterium]|nr:ABC transporter permease [Planctomycetia bacterium]